MFKLNRLTLMATVLGIMASFAPTADAGAVPRSQAGRYFLHGHRYHVFSVVFRGGERARIIVRGNGRSDLDVRVYDRHGCLVAQDLGWTDRCYVTWRPRRTGTFRVVVVNRGHCSNGYRIQTN